eukprot:3136300-Ditylum_brightwellii.AAC.1
MAQQQMPTYIQQGYQQPYNQQPYYHQQQHQPFTDCTNTYNSYHPQHGRGRNFNYNSTNNYNCQGRNNRKFYCWTHGHCNHPGPDCQSKCKVIKMRPCFKTEWEEVQRDVNDG